MGTGVAMQGNSIVSHGPLCLDPSFALLFKPTGTNLK